MRADRFAPPSLAFRRCPADPCPAAAVCLRPFPHERLRRLALPLAALVMALPVALLVPRPSMAVEAGALAERVSIHRDAWGVPHVHGETDAAVAYGSAWAQCEDHFFQLEDTYIQALGRYAEAVGEGGLRSDLEVAAFDLVESSERDFAGLPERIREIAAGFAAGYNDWVAAHPEEPRLLERLEPHHVLAFERFMILGRLLGAAHLSRRGLVELAAEMAGGSAEERGLRDVASHDERDDRLARELRASLGSNQWAVAPSRTRDGRAMLFINPHQPWYGSGMFTEMHVRSDQDGPGSWNFSGAMYPGAPFPTAGFNEHLGWAYTVNEAAIADVYRLTFDHPEDPLLYRYGEGYRTAEEKTVSLRVRVGEDLVERAFRLRSSHYGPVLARENEVHWLAVRVPKLYRGSRMVQALAQARARSFEEWYDAASMLQLQTFNTMYADADGHVFYLYNGTVPRRRTHDSGGLIDWSRPVDGSDPANEWQGFHPIEELPQILDPPSGYLQNCNSTPFTTTDDGNPSLLDFPAYMVEDEHDDKRRAKMSRYLLRRADDLTFEEFQDLAWDTTLYWPMTEIPVYERRLAALRESHPELAERVAPYFDHLRDWDFRSTIESTQATLAVEWYEQLYGRGYPVETLLPEYVFDVPARFEALIAAAERLEELYGDWRVPYGDVHRIQRHARQTSRDRVPFRDDLPSLPVAGVRGPLGVAFTVYHTPPLSESEAEELGIPPRQLQYATTGSSYQAVYEFGERTRGASYLHYGQSHRPESLHFFDQAKLLSERRFKPAWIHWDDVLANAVESYRPGQRDSSPAVR